MADLTLYGESTWQSPWVFHVMVALEELGLRYKLETLPLPIGDEMRAVLEQRALIGKVPCLHHGAVWLTESVAISEYLAEVFPPPQHAVLIPTDTLERARARQVMSYLRTGLFALREERPTSSVFQRPVSKPLSDKARAEALDLVRVANAVVEPGRTTMASTWCVADADLALALMRLGANSDSVLPRRLLDYALAQWSRPSVRRYLAYIPTTP
jgi:glutathione S-transferase